MKLNTREYVEAPLAFVYSRLADSEAWEGLARRRGADVVRTHNPAGPGLEWNVRFPWRGKFREADLTLVKEMAEEGLIVLVRSAPAQGEIAVSLAPAGQTRTLVMVSAEVKPVTMAARLVIQSLRLGRAKLQRRLDQSVARTLATIEDHRRAENRG